LNPVLNFMNHRIYLLLGDFMRVLFRLNCSKGTVILPKHYNYLLQALIYNSISPPLSRFLHEGGFMHGKRSFKLFTFSRLSGNYNFYGDKIVFDGEVSLWVSSPIHRFVKDLVNFLVKSGSLKLGSNNMRVAEVYIPEQPRFKGELKIRTLSPVTVYSTLYTPDGKKKTYYYSPYEGEFSELIERNARRKYEVWLGRGSSDRRLCVEPAGRNREVVVIYKGTVIKGWTGNFLLKGSKDLIKVVYECGLGSKNSQGFGMFEVV